LVVQFRLAIRQQTVLYTLIHTVSNGDFKFTSCVNSLNICHIERHFNETSIYQRRPHFVSNISVYIYIYIYIYIYRKSEYFRATESQVRSEHTLQNFYPIYPLQTIVNNFSKLAHTQLLYKLPELGLRLLMQQNAVGVCVGR
jgi:hypothetical protein